MAVTEGSNPKNTLSLTPRVHSRFLVAPVGDFTPRGRRTPGNHYQLSAIATSTIVASAIALGTSNNTSETTFDTSDNTLLRPHSY